MSALESRSLIVDGKELRRAVDSHLVEMCTFRRSLGRPRINVLGETEKVRMTRPLGVRVLNALIADMQSSGRMLDRETALLVETDRLRHAYVGPRLSKLAEPNRSANFDGKNWADQLRTLLGRLIVVGKELYCGRQIPIYVGSATALPIELEYFYNIRLGKAKGQSARANIELAIFERGLERLNGRTVEEAYRDEVGFYVAVDGGRAGAPIQDAAE